MEMYKSSKGRKREKGEGGNMYLHRKILDLSADSSSELRQFFSHCSKSKLKLFSNSFPVLGLRE